MSDILGSLRGLIPTSPDQVGEVLGEIKAKWATLGDDERAQVMENMQSLKNKIALLTDEQKTAIANKIASLR